MTADVAAKRLGTQGESQGGTPGPCGREIAIAKNYPAVENAGWADKRMPRFRVMLQGAPVFLLNVDSQKTDRLGFYATRWVRAASVDEARSLARRLILDELATWGTKNLPEQPIQMAVEDVLEVSWFEAARKGPGRGFTFYADAVS